jgi:hypothetical protein
MIERQNPLKKISISARLSSAAINEMMQQMFAPFVSTSIFPAGLLLDLSAAPFMLIAILLPFV